jgi:cysteine desulfurase
MDFNATTPVDPRVVVAMSPFWGELFANPASEHIAGRRVRQAVDAAREQVADALSTGPSTVVFTSGSTESINLALQGAVNAAPGHASIVTFATEHKAVLDTCAWLSRHGVNVDVLPVGSDGLPDLVEARDAIGRGTTVVSVMLANNETGVLGPVREIAEIARAAGALLHCDATQGLGKVAIDISDLGADLMSVSSHKAYGPKGVGALVVRREARELIEPLIHGGGHEHGLRSGTLNAAGIVGFGAACEIAMRECVDDARMIAGLRERLWRGIMALCPNAVVVGGSAPRVANTLNVRLPGQDATALLLAMPNVAASTGSACTASSPAPSHVLLAMGLGHEASQECIRFSLGRPSTQDDVDVVLASLARSLEAVAELTGSRR